MGARDMSTNQIVKPIKEISTAAPIKEIHSMAEQLDDKFFGEKTLQSRLIRGYLIMAVLVFFLPPILKFLFSLAGIPLAFYAATFPAMITVIIFVFIYQTIVYLVRPIEHLLLQVRTLQTGEMNVDLTMGGYQEIDRLVAATNRIRNSLQIATDFLGERKSAFDKSILKKLFKRHLTFQIMITYLFYGVSIVWVSGVVYSSFVEDFFSSFPLPWLIQGLLVIISGILLATLLGCHMTKSVGKPISHLAKTAERISVGDYDARFPQGLKGELSELVKHFISIKKALIQAEEQMEKQMEEGNENQMVGRINEQVGKADGGEFR